MQPTEEHAMSEYTATVRWQRGENEAYIDNTYSRGHEWQFDGGVTVPASASPHIVPLPYSVEANVDPEEAFVASISSCHMLFFLAIAAKKKFIVDEYVDCAIGVLEKDSDGRMAMTRVTLRPSIKFSGDKKPTREQLEELHHQSHEQCFIANSVRTEVTTEILP
jgi:organic hydroperoxide reductase OsmC/OhrA